jgi:hypothetical protein
VLAVLSFHACIEARREAIIFDTTPMAVYVSEWSSRAPATALSGTGQLGPVRPATCDSPGSLRERADIRYIIGSAGPR